MSSEQHILITGAAGRVGTVLRAQLARPGRILRLIDLKPIDRPTDSEVVITASAAEVEVMEEACRGVDAIIDLANRHVHFETGWEEGVDINMRCAFATFEAAHRQGVQRIVYTSTNHVVGYYPREIGIAPDKLYPRPDSNYAISKAVGEMFGSLYHDRYNMDVIVIRFGSYQTGTKPVDLRTLATWLSPDDAGRLYEACLSTPHPGYRIVWGVSANTRNWYSHEGAKEIGYFAQDDAEQYAPELIERLGEIDMDSPLERFLGGHMCLDKWDAYLDPK